MSLIERENPGPYGKRAEVMLRILCDEKAIPGARLNAMSTLRSIARIADEQSGAVNALRDAWGYLANGENDHAEVVIARAAESLGIDLALIGGQ